MSIKSNIEIVEEKIATACKKVGRNREEVTLIAVSKTKPIEDLKEAMENGMCHFGENKVQEIMDKYEHFPESQHWHMIGHLQRNKVKYIIDKVDLIHSVDSVRLAQTIEKEAAKKNIVMPILLEVNVAEEESKFGLKPNEVIDVITEIKDFEHVKVSGLMTVAPYVDNPEENRVVFRMLHKLFIDIKSKNIDNVDMSFLSMGMTGDYEVAIEEGATFVRVGTGIFGARNYNF